METNLTYALITHVPTYAGQSTGVLHVTEAFAEDQIAQAAALKRAGLNLTLVTPHHAEPDAKMLARERFVDFRPADYGITYIPLPAYTTMPQLIAAQGQLKAALVEATTDSAVVQMGAGGHPMSLGQFAWPLIDAARSKRIFVFADDPVPAREKAITSGRNPAKVLAKRMAVRTFIGFCRRAVKEASVVFAHDPAVEKRFAREWNDRCLTFVASPIGEDDLASPKAVAARAARLAKPKGSLRVVAVNAKTAVAGIDHLKQAIEKVKRFGIDATLTLSDPATLLAELDGADLFVATPLVPTENSAIFLAAARGLPIVSYRAGQTDARAEAAGAAVAIERGDGDRLSTALLELVRDRPTLSAMAGAARAWAATVTRDAVHQERAAVVRALIAS